MKDNKHTRRQLFVDRWVQGGLIFRAIMYWVYCVLAVSSLILTWSILTNPLANFSDRFTLLWQSFGPAVAASLLILPILAFDMVRYSNRFAGPIFRLHSAIRRAAEGEGVSPIVFREQDYWKDLAEDFNALVQRVHKSEELALQAKPDEEIGNPNPTAEEKPELQKTSIGLDPSTLPEDKPDLAEEEPAHA